MPVASGVRLVGRRAIGDRRRVEQHQVGEGAGDEPPAISQADVIGGERGHLADRRLEGEHLALAHVAAEDARIGAVAARVPPVELAVGAQIGLGPGEELLEVALHHAGRDDVLDPLLALRLHRLRHADELDQRPRGRLAALPRRSPPGSCRHSDGTGR